MGNSMHANCDVVSKTRETRDGSASWTWDAARAEIDFVSSQGQGHGQGPLPHDFIDFLNLDNHTMADDTTRQQPASSEKAFSAGQWKEAEPSYKPPENANLYAAAASQNTAGGSAGDVTLADAAKAISADSFVNLPKKPCVRDSLLTGMTAGFAVGSTRAIWRGMSHSPPPACFCPY